MQKCKILLLVLIICSIHLYAEKGIDMSKKYLDANRLKYHGYFYKNDVLGNKKELNEIRKFANMLVFSLVQYDTISTQMVRDIMDGNMDKD